VHEPVEILNFVPELLKLLTGLGFRVRKNYLPLQNHREESHGYVPVTSTEDLVV